MNALDIDHSGWVSAREMHHMVLRKGGSELLYTKLWDMMDVNKDGYVSLFELADVFGVKQALLRKSMTRLLVLGGSGFVGREVVRNAVECGFNVTSLSRRGANPLPDDELLAQATWLSGDATDPATVERHIREADAVVHAVGLLFDASSGLRKLNWFASGSDSVPGPVDTYDSVTRLSADVAIETLKSTAQSPEIGRSSRARSSRRPFVFISAAEAGWTSKDQASPLLKIVESALPDFLRRYIAAKRAVEAKLQEPASYKIRPVILRTSLIHNGMKKPDMVPLIPLFNLACALGVPFVDKAVSVTDVGRAAVAGLRDPVVSGIQRYHEIERLSKNYWQCELPPAPDGGRVSAEDYSKRWGGVEDDDGEAAAGVEGRRRLQSPLQAAAKPTQLEALQDACGAWWGRVPHGEAGTVKASDSAAVAALSDDPTERWFAEFKQRMNHWWLALPAGTTTTAGHCLGAIGLHLGARFDAALLAWRAALLGGGLSAAAPPPAMRPVTQAGCEWIHEGGVQQLPEFPRFPSEPDAFKAPLLPLPRLLPEWGVLRSAIDALADDDAPLVATAGGAPALHSRMAQAVGPLDIAFGVAAGVGVFVGTVACAWVLKLAQRRRRKLGRPSLTQNAPRQQVSEFGR